MRTYNYSTIEIIEQLKIGEVATPDNKTFHGVKRTNAGIIWWDINIGRPSEAEGDSHMHLSHEVLALKWHIQEQKLSLTEAMKEILAGNSVIARRVNVEDNAVITTRYNRDSSVIDMRDIFGAIFILERQAAN
ncbi:hypothetical protein FZC76_21705 [Sutcliffiella horikoshii]|uniref:Uncharacterized protein n=1 Tax=Sutcliffiella horikoshii TaxID=79883 RepID=A0A5D4SBZ6_9BACI|nr:hypothetical protein [Sutcliffiella horikoshii]TYS60489.1 hypothetical protein FZC76_21705 [Sutcliffiella horikoshii]